MWTLVTLATDIPLRATVQVMKHCLLEGYLSARAFIAGLLGELGLERVHERVRRERPHFWSQGVSIQFFE